MSLYTKNGKPLKVSGNKVYSKSGRIVGQITGQKVHGTNGGYVGTIVKDILVHRSSFSSSVGASFSASNSSGTAKGSRAGSAIWGNEPNIPD